MRVLVCGSRFWRDSMILDAVLDGIHCEVTSLNGEMTLIHGAQKSWDSEQRAHYGADFLAACWADGSLPPEQHKRYPADWRPGGVYDPGAGPKRNQRMLDEGKPDVVVAFKDGFQRDPEVPVLNMDGTRTGAVIRSRQAKGGTEDMVRRAKAAGIPVYIVSHG